MNTKTKKEEKQEQALVPVKKDAEALIALAIEKNVSVDTMERLLAMRRELKAERAKEEFDKAMAGFQQQCPTIEKKKQGYNYKYADLTDIVEHVKEILAKNGFSYTFDTDEGENAVIVYCKVKHIAGHIETSKARITLESTMKMNASQKSGAAMTYGKRYAFCNAFGILTGDEDTDASGGESNNQSRQQSETPNYLLSYKQQKNIFALLAEKGYAKKNLDAYIKTKFQKDSLSTLTMAEADILMKKIKFLPSKAEADTTEANEIEAEQIASDAAEALS
jgi:hypothetical protein